MSIRIGDKNVTITLGEVAEIIRVTAETYDEFDAEDLYRALNAYADGRAASALAFGDRPTTEPSP